MFLYCVHRDACAGDAPYDPQTGTTGRVDTWRDASRWRRGVFTGNVLFKAFNLGLSLAGLSMACLGMYGSGIAIKQTFLVGAATSFGCTAPV
jgi:hypothetical protein